MSEKLLVKAQCRGLGVGGAALKSSEAGEEASPPHGLEFTLWPVTSHKTKEKSHIC